MKFLSDAAEYALRAVVRLAQHPDRPQTAQEIADATHASAGYLVKILQGLVRAGLVSARRGPHGGYALLASPDRITIFDVIEVVDPVERICECPLGLQEHGTNLCPLHRRLGNAVAEIQNVFRQSTIQDLLDEPTTSRILGDGKKKSG